MGGKPDHDHTTALPFVCDMSLSAADTPHATPPPPFGLRPELALRGLHRGRIGPTNIAKTTWDASLHVSAGTLPDSDNVHYPIATRPPQSMLINKGVNDRSRDLVLGPAGQTSVPPLLSATTSPARSTTLLSPNHQCFLDRFLTGAGQSSKP